MVIKRLINNNIAVVDDVDHPGCELLVMGSGIGFKRHAGDSIDSERIEKRYRLVDASAASSLAELIEALPTEHVELADSLVYYVERSYGHPVNSTLSISILDHVSAAISRHQKGIDLRNPMLWDIKRFYPEEYSLGCDLLDIIDERLGVRLPEDEAGFLALHIANAQMDAPSIDAVANITEMIRSILNIVKYQLGIELDESSVYYYRFITHLKFFAQRVLASGEPAAEGDPTTGDLIDIIRSKHSRAFQVTFNIGDYLEKSYGFAMSDDERMYLAIHIARLLGVAKREGGGTGK